MAKVTGLGHFGIYVKDLPKMIDFYTNILGLTVTDHMGERGAFLSARPEEEHHEIALFQSDDQKTDAGQVSFPVETLADLRTLYHRVRDYGCQFDRVVNHGVAFGAYFRDPEGNRTEIYWPTGIDYPQPYGDPIDLDWSDERLMQVLQDMPAREATAPHLYGKDVGKRLASTKEAARV
jgi:catechol 2,3-dioxygenase-like lactoylglutathione lyase family enzyme